MILVDTGPLVALFDRKDPDHHACVAILQEVDEPLCSTLDWQETNGAFNDILCMPKSPSG